MKNEKVEMMITKERKNEVNIKKSFKKRYFRMQTEELEIFQ